MTMADILQPGVTHTAHEQQPQQTTTHRGHQARTHKVFDSEQLVKDHHVDITVGSELLTGLHELFRRAPNLEQVLLKQILHKGAELLHHTHKQQRYWFKTNCVERWRRVCVCVVSGNSIRTWCKSVYANLFSSSESNTMQLSSIHIMMGTSHVGDLNTDIM